MRKITVKCIDCSHFLLGLKSDMFGTCKNDKSIRSEKYIPANSGHCQYYDGCKKSIVENLPIDKILKRIKQKTKKEIDQDQSFRLNKRMQRRNRGGRPIKEKQEFDYISMQIYLDNV